MGATYSRKTGKLDVFGKTFGMDLEGPGENASLIMNRGSGKRFRESVWINVKPYK